MKIRIPLLGYALLAAIGFAFGVTLHREPSPKKIQFCPAHERPVVVGYGKDINGEYDVQIGCER